MQTDTLAIVHSDTLQLIKVDSAKQTIHTDTVVVPKVKALVSPSPKKNTISPAIVAVQEQLPVFDSPYEVQVASFDSTLHTQFSCDGLTSKTVFKQAIGHPVYPYGILEQRNSTLRGTYHVLVLSIMASMLIIMVRRIHRDFFPNIVGAVFSTHAADRILREKNMLTRRAYFLLNVYFIISISIFLWIVLKKEMFAIHYMRLELNYWIIVLTFIAVLLIRHVIYFVFGEVFQVRDMIKQFIHNNFLVLKALAFFLLPLSFCIFFAEGIISEILYSIGVLLILSYLALRIFKGIQIMHQNRVSILYSILYLCTLEILPVILGTKYLMSLV